ncbi:MAG: amino acid ABC transporter substrate-binding protein [Candidatus Dactylopiibacterium sp.]|nr:amino acid ABC transporter substrate-binding protein [Candidatus Dactylopiibacterium sp.]
MPITKTLLALILGLGAVCAGAQSIDTLARIRQSRTITLGNREAARPFSYLDAQGQPVGYALDLCLRVVERLRRDLKLPDLKVKYLTVSGAERIPRLVEGAIDLECGSTTNTKARQEQVAFSYTTFVAGMKLLTRKGSSVTTVASLAGANIALSKGTTSEKLFNQLRDREVQSASFQTYASNAEALKALQSGKASVFPQDDVLLAGLISSLPDRDSYVLAGDYLSIEPYAIMVRKNDSELLRVVDQTLADTYASGEINRIYERWFNTPAMQVPMSRLTREAFARPAKDSGFARVLGYTL